VSRISFEEVDVLGAMAAVPALTWSPRLTGAGDLPIDMETTTTTTTSKADAAIAAPIHQPDIIYFGAGQWLMWPVPFVHPPHSWTSFMDWRCLESDVSHAAARYQKMASKRVVTSSVHPVCDQGEWKGPWKSLMDEFRLNESETAAPCADLLLNIQGSSDDDDVVHAQPLPPSTTQSPLEPLLNNHNQEEEALSRISACRAGFRSAAGPIKMNSRLAKTVAVINKEARALFQEERSEPALGYVDAHAIMSGHCDLNFPSSDRIHFAGLVYDELSAFLREIDW
jgi:hypothetical protein